LLDVVEVTFNDVASLVVFGVEGRWSSATRASAFTVGDLIRRLGNHRTNPTPTEPDSRCSAGVGLVAADSIGAGTWPTTAAAIHFQVCEQMLEHRSVMGLARAYEHHQRSSAAVDKVMDLAGQSTAGAANAVVRRLDRQIRVIRPSPPCRG
jgi:hypothetical protein